MVAQLVAERDFRGPGCSDACEIVKAIVPGRFGRTEMLLHDPAAHEEYGRITAGPQGKRTIVWTGPLVVDRWARTAALYGTDLRMSGQEWALLDYLAGQLGRCCSHAEILTSAWGPSYAEETHLLRITMVRLRARLGETSHDTYGLIRTVFQRGYMLADLPPVEVERPIPFARTMHEWSRDWPWCACCGSVDRIHNGHGRCTRCRPRPMNRYPHWGPCGAPPASDVMLAEPITGGTS